MTAISSVVIVGGGIVGLVCARALALNGVHVVLLERKSAITDEGGIGIGLQSNAMNALSEIGLAQACLDHGVPVETITVCAPNGSPILSRPPERYGRSPWPGYTGISRAWSMPTGSNLACGASLSVSGLSSCHSMRVYGGL